MAIESEAMEACVALIKAANAEELCEAAAAKEMPQIIEKDGRQFIPFNSTHFLESIVNQETAADLLSNDSLERIEAKYGTEAMVRYQELVLDFESARFIREEVAPLVSEARQKFDELIENGDEVFSRSEMRAIRANDASRHLMDAAYHADEVKTEIYEGLYGGRVNYWSPAQSHTSLKDPIWLQEKFHKGVRYDRSWDSMQWYSVHGREELPELREWYAEYQRRLALK